MCVLKTVQPIAAEITAAPAITATAVRARFAVFAVPVKKDLAHTSARGAAENIPLPRTVAPVPPSCNIPVILRLHLLNNK
jgi:hypothetical protein